jgi:hypothetical protein
MKDFIPYELALELKQLGFDEPCFGCYDEKRVFGLTVMSIKQYYTNSKEDTWNCSAPTYSQAFRWVREKYGYYISVFRTHDSNWGTDLWLLGVHKPKATVFSETYEEAELACLKKLIEIVKTK